MRISDEDRARVEEYARMLAEAGFEVWLTRAPYRDAGYLAYRDPATDLWGSFQYSDHEGWQHYMPLKPSRENGSSMHIDPPLVDEWTVEAARRCASETNWNEVVGTQRNGREVFRSPNALRFPPVVAA